MSPFTFSPGLLCCLPFKIEKSKKDRFTKTTDETLTAKPASRPIDRDLVGQSDPQPQTNEQA